MGKTPKFALAPTSDLTKNDEVVIATKEMVDVAKNEFDTERKKYEDYNFLVNVDLEAAKILLDFINTKAKWKFRNSFGIVQCSEIIQKQIELLTKKNTKGIYFKSIELEAISYFVANHEDVGLSYAEQYIKIVDPLFETMQEATKWRNKMELLRQKYVLYEDSFEEQIPIESVNLKAISDKEKELKEK